MSKDKNSKIGGVRGTSGTSNVERTKQVGEIEKTEKASGVGGVGGIGSISNRRNTRIMTMEERSALFDIINEEAEKLFSDSGLSSDHQKVVKEAVKKAVDAAIVEGDSDDE